MAQSPDALAARFDFAGPDPQSLETAEQTVAVILDPRRRGELYPYLRRLHELEPRHRTEALHGRPARLITSHADAVALLSNHALVSDERNAQIFDTGPSGERFFELMKRTLLYMDPAAHDRIRAMIAREFTPRAIERYEPLMQRVVGELLDRAADAGEVGLVRDLAYALPTAVICEIMGVPGDDLAIFHEWLNDFARRGDVSGVTPDVIAAGEAAVAGFTDYFLDLVRERRRHPGDDLVTILTRARDEQGPLTDDELVALCILMIQAGHETTADMIGLGVLALLRHPDELHALRDDPALIRNAIEEMLRYDGSNQLVQRVSHEDFELGDTKIAAGEVCSILTGAAGRDPARFEDPDRLDIRRKDIQHFGFGGGSHVCLGASLARGELRMMIGGLIERFPDLELGDGELAYRDSLVLRGLKNLPLRLTRRSGRAGSAAG
jgi:cytochrome P450